MPVAEQLSFPFPSLDFPGRTTVKLGEIAERLGVSVRHLCNELDDGTLVGVDLKAKGVTKRCVRIPREIYHAYIMARLTGPISGNKLIAELPRSVRLQLLREIEHSLR